MSIRYVIHGTPRTKKTSNRVIRAGLHLKILPSRAYCEYEDIAVKQLEELRGDLPTILCPVSVRATFYRDAKRGDWTGYAQALGDILQKAKIIQNDAQIVHWDGTRLDKDADRPRVEVEITELWAQ